MPGTVWSSNRVLKPLSSVQTGIILLILVGVASIAGTLVLQRPLTEPAVLERTYSPQTLRWLDAIGLTDLFHAWWFIALMALLCANIILASLERFPAAWRYFSRPYLRPALHFLSGLPMQQEIEIPAVRPGLEAAARALAELGLKPKRVGPVGAASQPAAPSASTSAVASANLAPEPNPGRESTRAVEECSLYAERHRWARLAPYVVHASLLLILGGGIVDALWGFRGFVSMTKNQTINEIELRNGATRALPFALRCDNAGQENYPDGSPRRWWTQLAVLEGGREILRKEIAVNEPLTYAGLRFFQSSYGSTGEVGAIQFSARRKDGASPARQLTLALGDRTELDAQTSVRFAAFIPDFVVVGGRVETRSNEPNNPAIQLLVESQGGGGHAGELAPAQKVWLFPRFPNFSHDDRSPYAFQFQDMHTGYYTGLQVAYEPGQWTVWAGAILMAIGLFMAFYMVHIRFWVVPIADARGRHTLWVGASAAKNREEFEQRFRNLVEAIHKQLEQPAARHGQHAPAAIQAKA